MILDEDQSINVKKAKDSQELTQVKESNRVLLTEFLLY